MNFRIEYSPRAVVCVGGSVRVWVDVKTYREGAPDPVASAKTPSFRVVDPEADVSALRAAEAACQIALGQKSLASALGSRVAVDLSELGLTDRIMAQVASVLTTYEE